MLDLFILVLKHTIFFKLNGIILIFSISSTPFYMVYVALYSNLVLYLYVKFKKHQFAVSSKSLGE
jgi:hypothetical protein